jgi:hypothetical protein
MRAAVKVVPLAVLGCAAALLVACGDRNGLLSGSDSSGLQDALAAARSACLAGQDARAELAAERFADRVAALPPGSVDRRLIANLQQGAVTLEALVAQTCNATTDTTPPTVTTTTTPTTVTTTTTPTTTAPTTPTTPTEPPTTPTSPTIPPDTDPEPPSPSDPGDGSGGAGPGGSGGAGAPQGGLPPGLAKKDKDKPK